MYFNESFPWEFEPQKFKSLYESEPGLYGLFCSDPYISKIFQREVLNSNEHTVLTGSDVTLSWFEESFCTLSLFGGVEKFLILNAEQIKYLEGFVEKQNEIDESRVMLLFTKDNASFEKISKSNPGKIIKIKAPRFWEGEKLIHFLLKKMNTSLPYEFINFLVEALPLDSGEYINAIKKIILLPKSELNLATVKEIVGDSKLDHFYYSDLWNNDKKDEFFKKLVDNHFSQDHLRLLFSFMQGHLIKIYDTSYLSKKKKLSQYDKKILNTHQKYEKEEIIKDIKVFRELELSSKINSGSLLNDLRRQVINYS